MDNVRKYGRVKVRPSNTRADLRWMKKAVRKNRAREWRGKNREEKA